MQYDFVEIESIRIVLLVLMLGIAGIFDFKTRRIPDVIWLVFGGIGALLYAWDYDKMTSYHVITIFTSVFVGIALWRWKIAGVADSFTIFAMTVILPVHYGFVMMPIVILIAALFLVVIVITLYNVTLNTFDLIRSKKMIFSEFKTESRYRKAFAFLAIHRKRKYEKFVITAENSMSITPRVKSFVFLFPRNKRNGQVTNEMYVQNIPPLITFMFGVAVFLLLPKILNMLF